MRINGEPLKILGTEKQRTMNRSRLIVLTGLTILVIGCATDKRLYNPLKVPREEIQKHVKVVAVAPLSINEELPNAKPAHEEFAALLIAELNSIGFQTISPSEYEQTFNRLRDEAGGLFDPMTGKADKEKYQKIRELFRQELATNFHVDAIIYPEVITHSVQFNMNEAHWNGVRESILPPGLWAAAGLVMSTHGDAPALSFCVTLEDMDGKHLYVDCGGLQLLKKTTGNVFVPVPVEKILTDHKRNANSVGIALSDLHAPATKHN
jgi:hypothetical protein